MLFEQPAQLSAPKGLSRNPSAAASISAGGVAAADGEDGGLAAGAQLADQRDSVQPRHLRVHQDRPPGSALAGWQHSQRVGAVRGGVDGVAAHGEHRGQHLAADHVVVNQQDRRELLFAPIPSMPLV